MSKRIVLLATLACGLTWGDAQAQLALRKQARQTTSGVCLAGGQEVDGVSGACACADGGAAPCHGDCGAGYGAGHIRPVGCVCPCGCAQGTCQSLPYPRCFRFQSPCVNRAACDPCCGTIFSEMYCDMRDAVSRLGCVGRPVLGGPIIGGGLFGLSRSEDCCDGSCSHWSEPGCAYEEPGCAYEEPGCAYLEPACGVAEIGCGIAEPPCAVAIEPQCGCAEPNCACLEPACGVAVTCEPGCGCEPACGVAVGCEPGCGVSDGCFQDLIGPSCGPGAVRGGCGGCGGCGLVRPGLFASIGNLLFGGCHAGCSSCAAYDGTYADCGCAATDEVYYSEGDAPPARNAQPVPAVPQDAPPAADSAPAEAGAARAPAVVARRSGSVSARRTDQDQAPVYVGHRPAAPSTTRAVAPATPRSAPAGRVTPGGRKRPAVAPTSHGDTPRQRVPAPAPELELRPPHPPISARTGGPGHGVRRVNHDLPSRRATRSHGGHAFAILFGGDES